MASKIFIFSIVLGAWYLFYVKSNPTFALTFLGYIISVLAGVGGFSDEKLLRPFDEFLPREGEIQNGVREYFG